MEKKRFNNHIIVFFHKIHVAILRTSYILSRKRVIFLYFVEISHESTALIKKKTIQYFL